jgi:hypothetical protein
MKNRWLFGIIALVLLAYAASAAYVPQQTCTDSDEGINYYKAGTATGGGSTVTDKPQVTAWWGFVINEAYCAPDESGRVYNALGPSAQNTIPELYNGLLCSSYAANEYGACEINQRHISSWEFSFLDLGKMCDSYTYSNWGSCDANGKQRRTILSKSPAECNIGNAALMRYCADTACAGTKCTSFTYSNWGDVDLQYMSQTRTITSASPSGCVCGNPQTTQAVIGTTVASCTDSETTPPELWKYGSWGSYYIQGTISAMSWGTSTPNTYKRYPDICLDEQTLLELTCLSFPYSYSWIWAKPIACANGCQNGACRVEKGGGAQECQQFTYTADYGPCELGLKVRNVTSASPAGCWGGTPDTYLNCGSAPPSAGKCTTTAVWRSDSTRGFELKVGYNADGSSCVEFLDDWEHEGTQRPKIIASKYCTSPDQTDCTSNYAGGNIYPYDYPSCPSGKVKSGNQCVSSTCTSPNYINNGYCMSWESVVPNIYFPRDSIYTGWVAPATSSGGSLNKIDIQIIDSLGAIVALYSISTTTPSTVPGSVYSFEIPSNIGGEYTLEGYAYYTNGNKVKLEGNVNSRVYEFPSYKNKFVVMPLAIYKQGSAVPVNWKTGGNYEYGSPSFTPTSVQINVGGAATPPSTTVDNSPYVYPASGSKSITIGWYALGAYHFYADLKSSSSTCSYCADARESTTGQVRFKLVSDAETHLACFGNACARVPGIGNDECSWAGGAAAGLGSKCGSTHLGCVDGTCKSVSGSGVDQCSAVGKSCSNPHYECVTNENKCYPMLGFWDNTCTTDNNCGSSATHLVCSSGKCASASGTGVDQCSAVGVDCGSPHMLCVGNTCTSIEGYWDNTCSVNGDCTALLYTCTNIPNYADLCLGTDTGLSGDTPSTLLSTASCGSSPPKCSYNCTSGYVYNSGSCVSPTYSCQGSFANADLCPGTNVVNQNTPSILLSTASCGSSPPKCSYVCKSEYHYSSGACVPNVYSCFNDAPSNSLLCSNDADGLTKDVAKHLVTSCSSGSTNMDDKCEYICDINNGYHYYNDGSGAWCRYEYYFACVNSQCAQKPKTGSEADQCSAIGKSCGRPRTVCDVNQNQCKGIDETGDIVCSPIGGYCFPACVGPMPDSTKTKVCLNDEAVTSGNPERQIVDSCHDNVKCEYTCDESKGYYYDDVTHICVQHQCTGTMPDEHAALCQNDNSGLTKDVGLHLVETCSTDSTDNDDKCEVVCANSYEYHSTAGFNKRCISSDSPEVQYAHWLNMRDDEIDYANKSDRVQLRASGANLIGNMVNFTWKRNKVWPIADEILGTENVSATDNIITISIILPNDGTSDEEELYFEAETIVEAKESNMLTVTAVENTPPFVEIVSPKEEINDVFLVNKEIDFKQISYDVDSNIVSYRWDFDDNRPAGTTPNTTRAFASVSDRTATLTVTDEQGGQTIKQVSFHVVPFGVRLIADIKNPTDNADKGTIVTNCTGLNLTCYEVDYSGENSYVINITNDSLNNIDKIFCLAGNCPEKIGSVQVQMQSRSFDNMSFNWTFNAEGLAPESNYARTKGQICYASPYDKKINLAVNYSDKKDSAESVFKLLDLRQCSKDGNIWYRLDSNGNIIAQENTMEEDSTICRGVDGKVRTADDCCPVGWMCSNTGCVLVDAAPKQCDSYVTEQDCNEDLIQRAKNEPLWDYNPECEKTINGNNVLCGCKWTSDGCRFVKIKRESTCGSSVSCTYSTSISDCVDGYQTVSIKTQGTNQYWCTKDNNTSPGLICGMHVVEMPFLTVENIVVTIAILFVIYWFYLKDTSIKNRKNNKKSKK